ncbi:LacI family DNA-binding transcriptional regulator [Georgenia halophila]|uniref:LacI family DNA-binding transcriptional regulator n=1 Tax=Georgenia halophila TaxID=620889 RepID=A0ABP8LEP5_9MICO
MRRARPSMTDVGRAAQVSAQTVSRYFTGQGYVSAATRARIAAAVDELGYHPNASARSFRSQRSSIVGVLTMGSLEFGSIDILTGLGRSARTHGYTLAITQIEVGFEPTGWEDEAGRALAHFVSMPADGVIILSPITGVEDVVSEVTGETPVVVVSERPRETAGSVGAHSYTAGVAATRHLIELGHREIAHVAGPATRNEAHERERGYRAAMAGAGLDPIVIAGASDWSAVSGYAAADHLGDVTGVFAVNDEIALGVMSAMAQRGRMAPRDYSIVGVDDMPSAAYFSPPLTTMRLDFLTLGARAFDVLADRIEGTSRSSDAPLEPALIVRASTGSPRGA